MIIELKPNNFSHMFSTKTYVAGPIYMFIHLFQKRKWNFPLNKDATYFKSEATLHICFRIRRPKFWSLLRPEGHFFHTTWGKQI